MKKIINIKEEKVLRALRSFFSRNNKMPSIRELGRELVKFGLDLKSTKSIQIYLKKLENKGFIKKNKERKYDFIGACESLLVNIPIYGGANAGAPTLIGEQYLQGTLKISKNLLRGGKEDDYFAVEVSGSSMNKSSINRKKIESGDFVIIDSGYKNYKGDGSEKVLAIIDGLATIKTFKKIEEDMIGLFPESTEKKHRPIFISQEDDFIINGRVVDVLKT
ncbi:MAG: hypothetical protein PF549_03275 [Patescibacteria group bacterium]|jgi:SOS-response transcriptional repressor LexA|nr:hypothetical protein [Patescibacteria group bacterium]